MTLGQFIAMLQLGDPTAELCPSPNHIATAVAGVELTYRFHRSQLFVSLVIKVAPRLKGAP
jgi:hypothetical protein